MTRVYDEINRAIKNSQSIAIICHTNPDGDCVGASIALALAFKQLDKSIDVLCEGEKRQNFKVLSASLPLLDKPKDSYDLAIAVDCGDIGRLGGFGKLFSKTKTTINIDHHHSNPNYADINLVASSSSTCEIVYDFLVYSGFSIDNEIAACLFGGILTDTGGFLHSNTSPKTHLTVAALKQYDFDFDLIINSLFKMRSKSKIKLLALALKSLRFYCEDKIAVITLLKEDLDSAGCTFHDTEGIVNFALDIEGVDIGICITQQGDNLYKISIRSNSDQISAANAASYFGGGGHIRAAGCAASGDLEDILSKLLKAASDQFPF